MHSDRRIFIYFIITPITLSIEYIATIQEKIDFPRTLTLTNENDSTTFRKDELGQIKSNLNNSVFVIKMYKCEFAPPTSLMRNVEFNLVFFSIFLLFIFVKLKSGLYGM